jgi:membrane protein implicated in regulation of membrane protease activity
MFWSVWWVWIAGGFVVGIIEVLVPGFIFLGFAGGAIVTGILLGFGLVGGQSLSLLLMIFAFASLVIWGALRMIIGTRPGQVKLWKTDIND